MGESRNDEEFEKSMMEDEKKSTSQALMSFKTKNMIIFRIANLTLN